MLGIFKLLLELYVHVFKEYPLAAAFTTALFAAGYYAWNYRNKSRGRTPRAVWEKPGFVLFIGWCILTPMLGFVVSVVAFLKDGLVGAIGLYVSVFKAFMSAGAIITTSFVVIYFAWKFVIKKRPPHGKGSFVLGHPAALLLVAWLVAVPVLGLILGKGPAPSPRTQEGKQTTAAPAAPK
jgi:hypothetical protein